MSLVEDEMRMPHNVCARGVECCVYMNNQEIRCARECELRDARVARMR